MWSFEFCEDAPFNASFSLGGILLLRGIVGPFFKIAMTRETVRSWSACGQPFLSGNSSIER